MQKQRVKIVGSIIIALVLLCWWGYNSFFRPDLSNQKQLTDQFGAEFFNFTAEAPVGDKPVTVSNEPSTTAFLEEIEEKQIARIKDKPLNENVSPELISEESIILKYTPQFQILEKESASRLDTVYTAAVQEYQEQSMAGTLNHSEWTRKYLQACISLQDNADNQFYRTLNAMEAELVANNQSTAVIAEIKQEYNAAKPRKIAELLARAHR